MRVFALAASVRLSGFWERMIFATVAFVAGCSGGDDAETGASAQGGGGSGSGVAGAASSGSGSGGKRVFELEDSGAEILADREGITGTVEGIPYTSGNGGEVRDYGESFLYILIEAIGDRGTWTLGLPKEPGVHACGKHTDIAGGEVAYILGPAGTGTAGPLDNSACTVEVESFEDVVEGRFAGLLMGEEASPLSLTAGYFKITRN